MNDIKKVVLRTHENEANRLFLAQEQEKALRELEQDSHFQPVNDNDGPYTLTLAVEDHRLVLYLKNDREEDLQTLILSLKPYRRLIQDYFLMIRSYEKARRESTREKLEAIDMGRRGIHNEGADLLMDRLKGKITMNHETARKLFTLICVLHRTDISLMEA